MNIIKSITISGGIGRTETRSINYERVIYTFNFTKNKLKIHEVKQINRIFTDNNKYGLPKIPTKEMFEQEQPYDDIVESNEEFSLKDIQEINSFLGSCWIKLTNGEESKFHLNFEEEMSENKRKEFVSDLNNTVNILRSHNVNSSNQLDEILSEKLNDYSEQLKKVRNNENEHLLENEIFLNILKNNQKRIIEIDREYVQKFIKLNIFLKQKRDNLILILDKVIFNIEEEIKIQLLEREEEINFFKGLVYSYNLMVNHSIVMVSSLVEDDMITFYEIYEIFDKMNIFNTNWENEVNDKLSEINESLQDLNFSIKGLMNQMRDMEMKLVSGLNQINKTIEISMDDLTLVINKQLSETNSRLKYENLTNYYKKSTLPGSMDWFDGPKQAN